MSRGAWPLQDRDNACPAWVYSMVWLFGDQEYQGPPQFPNMMGSRAEMNPLGAGTVGVCDLSLPGQVGE